MMRAFMQVDVFTGEALLGNPVAVVLDGRGLTLATMQRFTDWTNLSEATFVLPPTHPDADYAVRIFCPGRELPFAGHPTLGTCHAWLAAGGVPKSDVIVQECGAGLVPIRRDDATGALAFSAPALLRSGPLDDAALDEAVAALRIDRDAVLAHQWCDNGPGWRAVMLASADDVLAVRPVDAVDGGMDVGVIGPYPDGSPQQFEVRAFFTDASGGLREDPVTGSLNAALAQWLIGAGLAPDAYVAAQGACVGRAGRVQITSVDDAIWVGGTSVTVLTGTAHI